MPPSPHHRPARAKTWALGLMGLAILLCQAFSVSSAQAPSQPGVGFYPGSPPQTVDAGSEPIYWGQHGLVIPYRWAGHAVGQSGYQVVLYYSADRGREWKVASTATPQVRSFLFQSPGDGEYWFATRTYDRSGAFQPRGPIAAEMRVVVDTVGPRIDLLEGRFENGVCTIDVHTSDTTGLLADVVRVYAQADGRGGWSPVALHAESSAASAVSLRLSGVWRPPAGSASISLRATAQDRAGNRSERNASVSAAQPIAGTYPDTTQRNRGWAGGPALPPASGPARSSAVNPADPFSVAEARSPNRSSFDAPNQPSPYTTGRTESFSRKEPTRQPPPSQAWPAEPPRTRTFAKSAPDSGSARDTDSPFSTASLGGWGSSAREETRRSASDSAFERSFGGPSTVDAAPARRMVNNTEFEFDYELDQTGRWGVAKVELWGTENGGRSWRRMAIDSDRQSPIHVSTPGEGEYGFRIVVESVGGLEPVKPQPGDRPDASVVVDLQRPRAMLRGAKQGDGYFADQLSVDWRVDDENLAAQPIDLFYSNRPSGPWIPIATNLSNSGRHSWRLQRHLPQSLFVRLEARDAAGNVGVATTPEPIAIDVPSASGSLRGVRAAGR